MIRLEGLRVRAGTFELPPLDWTVAAGEWWGIIGPSGSGKTKLLEVIAGLFPAAGGRLHLDGAEATAAAPEERSIGFAPQDALLFPHLNVRGNIMFGARAPAHGARASLEELAETFSLTALLERPVAGLSGGERQRVALARALYRINGRIDGRMEGPNQGRARARLLLDEPLAALSAELRAATLVRIAAARHAGATILQTAHSAADLPAVDGLLELPDGRIGPYSHI